TPFAATPRPHHLAGRAARCSPAPHIRAPASPHARKLSQREPSGANIRAYPKEALMTLRIGDTAPNFQAETTQGRIDFHDWIGDKWAVLFSHPKDFTPVCTTELGYMARIKPEFDRRNAKIIGLSADPVDDHTRWAKDIEETQGTAPNYPIIGDADLKVAKLYDMLPAEAVPGKRTPADNATVRTAFLVGPDKQIKLTLFYPTTT